MAHCAPNYIPLNKKNQTAFKNPPSSVRDVKKATKDMRDRAEDDRKLNPSKYGSIREFDLGLCYETWFTAKSCRFGNDCPWRHEELTPREEAWMLSMGANCVEGMKGCRMLPERPKVTDWDIKIAGQ